MGAKRKFKDDRKAYILHIDKCPPYREQESEELPDEMVARLLRADLFELPVTGDLRLAGTWKD